MDTEWLISISTKVLEYLGVGVITLGVLVTSATSMYHVVQRKPGQAIYDRYRRQVGKGILIGLELLVAADIIRTVAVRPSFESVGVLAAVVLIRTFLSFTLEVEMTGRWPWQHGRDT